MATCELNGSRVLFYLWLITAVIVVKRKVRLKDNYDLIYSEDIWANKRAFVFKYRKYSTYQQTNAKVRRRGLV